jgi:hypothetical protein
MAKRAPPEITIDRIVESIMNVRLGLILQNDETIFEVA